MLAASEFAARVTEGDGFVLPPTGQEDLKLLKRPRGEDSGYGFRDRVRVPERKGDSARVVVLGDSVTVGQGVAADQVFTRVAERSLDGVEVLNFGQTGFDIQQVVGMARDRLGDWQPDLVVYAFHTNDRVETEVVRVGSRGHPIHVGTGLSPSLAWLRRQSALVRLWLGAHTARALAASGAPDPGRQEAFFATWAPRLVEVLGDTPLWVFTVPHHRLAASDCPSWTGDAAVCSADEGALAQATAVYEELGVVLVHGRQAMAALGADALVLPADPHHPNARGHQALGEVLAEALQAHFSLPDPPG